MLKKSMNNDEAFMDVALENARLAMTAGEVPIIKEVIYKKCYDPS